jgi:hypothetical protein
LPAHSRLVVKRMTQPDQPATGGLLRHKILTPVIVPGFA